jgi:sigma-E factor negative regulatory protein RseA
MIKEKREALSALLDEELPGRIFDQLVTDLGQDEDLREAMSRYRMIGDVLRGDGSTAVASDLALAVRARLADEPAILAPRRGRAAVNWGRGVAGLAIAASVALIAVGLVSERTGMRAEPNEQATVAAATPQRPNDSTDRLARPASTPGTPATEDNAGKKLARYLAEHNEFASRGAANGFMSYANFVAYDGR